jgi:hypothetical protein
VPSNTLESIHGVPVLVLSTDGPVLRGDAEAVDLIGEAFGHQVDWVVIPAGRFTDEFFELRTRIAGDMLQKFANYRINVAILGDISRHTAASKALTDFVTECNRGRQLWFLADQAELAHRLEGMA